MELKSIKAKDGEIWSQKLLIVPYGIEISFLSPKEDMAVFF